MQRSQGRYIDQVVCMYKKDGGGEGTRHESVLFAGTKDVPSLTNLGLRVFIQASGAFFLLACIDFNSRTSKTHPEESENSFWHYSKSTGHLPVSRNSSTISKHPRSAPQTADITL